MPEPDLLLEIRVLPGAAAIFRLETLAFATSGTVERVESLGIDEGQPAGALKPYAAARAARVGAGFGLSPMAFVGFIVNPIAGMGGRVGLKGTDDVEAGARQRGAEPSARSRAMAMLQALQHHLQREVDPPQLRWLTCSGEMGAGVLAEAGFAPARVLALPPPGRPSSARDTRAAAAEFLAAGVDLVLFCGGDGTARDIGTVVGSGTPMLGIPAGVKMYSGVFGVSPSRTAECSSRSFSMASAASYAIRAASLGTCPPAPACAVSLRAE